MIRPYRNGRDLNGKSRGVYAIDFYGLTSEEAQNANPAAYQHVLETVRPERETNRRASYRKKWWLFGENSIAMRESLTALPRYIGLSRNSRHHVFHFLDAAILPDAKIITIGLAGGSEFAILSSLVHRVFARARGGWLGVGNDHTYYPPECFDPFPFPDLTDKPALKARLDDLGERLDAFRKERLAEHAFLTMTKLYNVLERVRALEAASASTSHTETPAKARTFSGAQSRGLSPNEAAGSDEGPGSALPSGNSAGGKEVPPLTDAERDIYQAGLIGVLKDIHGQIDDAVFEAYGWPSDLTEEEILEKLVALNHERAAEEARGHVRWLRPDFQNPTGQTAAKPQQSEIVLPEAAKAAAGAALPADDADRARAVRSVLAAADHPLSAEDVAARFKGRASAAKLKKVTAMLSILEAVGQAESTDDKRWFAGG